MVPQHNIYKREKKMAYTTSTYTWKVISIDASTNHMLVEYSTDSTADKLNLPIPAIGEDIAAHIDKFAPKNKWVDTSTITTDHVSTGTNGTSILTEPEPDPGPSDTVQFMGTYHEEYIRALIYQIIEETKTESL